MSEPTSKEYPQPSLVPPEVLEVTIRIGVVGSADLAQVLVEARSGTDGTLLEMESRWAGRLADLDATLAWAFTLGEDMVRRNTVPF